MTSYKVLVPLDGSAFSRFALPAICRLLPPQLYALALLRVAQEPAGRTGNPPHLVYYDHTFMPLYESAGDANAAHHPIYGSQVAENVEAALEDDLSELASSLGGYDVSTITRFGDPAEEIVRCIEDERIDVVAMATHGRTGLRKLTMGSVADRVLRRATVPVLLFGPAACPYPEQALLAMEAIE